MKHLCRAQLIGSCCISSQWACCSTFKYWSAFLVMCFQKPSSFPSSTWIDLLWVINVKYILQQLHVLLARRFIPAKINYLCHFHYHANHLESCHDRIFCYIFIYTLASDEKVKIKLLLNCNGKIYSEDDDKCYILKCPALTIIHCTCFHTAFLIEIKYIIIIICK